MCLIVVLAPFVGDLGQDVVRLLVLIFGIADHHLDHWRLKLRQGSHTGSKLLKIRGILKIRNTTKDKKKVK